MFNTKTEVDRHVQNTLHKFKTDSEVDSKCFSFAKLYLKVKDYDSAVKYISRYITNVSNNAQSQRLLGECYEKSNRPSKALEAYRTSIELDGKQKDLIEKVCELLCNPELPLVGTQANYWLDRLEGLQPNHPIVFKLKERILHSDPLREKNPMELEKLILSEIMAHPSDPRPRIRLLKLLVETKRAKLAQAQAGELLSRGVFRNHLAFYECLAFVAEAYEKEGDEVNLDFQLNKLSVLERRSYLTLQDCGSEIRSIGDSTSALFSFDQGLHLLSTKFQPKPADRVFLQSALAHFRGQLAYHLAVLKLRRAKKEPGEWQRAVTTVSPLLLYATGGTAVEGHYETFHRDWWIVDGAERVSVAAHVLRLLSEEKGPMYLSEIAQPLRGKWRERVYEKLFYSEEQNIAMKTSSFINDASFLSMPAALPSDTELAAFDKESQSGHPQSLHHAIWLGLVNLTSSGLIREDLRCEVVPELPLTVSNLNNGGPQTLNQLDVDSFLYAAVFCSKSQSRNNLSTGRPPVLPVSITEVLCTGQQSEWWTTMYETYMNLSSSNTSEARLRLRKGIETVRALGNHRMHPKLLVLMAKQFELRASDAPDAATKEALEKRIEFYWTAAIPLLERLEKRQLVRDVSAKLFEYNAGDWEPSEIRSALEDGKLFIGCQLMNQAKYEDAIEAFQALKSPYATYYQAKIYMKLAREVMNREGEAITSEHRSQYVILLRRARDSLRITEDRLRRPSISSNHPLHALLTKTSDEVDQDMSRFEEDGKENKSRFETESDMAIANSDHLADLSAWSQNCTEIPTPRVSRQALSQSTPRGLLPVRQGGRPFPEMEVIDGQLKQLVLTQESILDETRILRSDFGDVKVLLREMLSEFKKLSCKLDNIGTVSGERAVASHQPHFDDLKPDDLLEFPGEEEYGSEEFPSFSNVQQQYGAAARGLQQYLPTMFPLQRPDPASLLQYYPNYVWSPGLPFSEGQQLPDFRGGHVAQHQPPPAVTATQVVPAPVASTPLPYAAPKGVAGDSKQVPNVVITSSDTLPTYTTGAQPAMSVTIPPQHVRHPHQFQISLPTTPIGPPLVTQSPSDKYQARAYDPLPQVATTTVTSPKKQVPWAPAAVATGPQPTTPAVKPVEAEKQKTPLLSSILSSPSAGLPLLQSPFSKPSTPSSVSFAIQKTPPSGGLNSSQGDPSTPDAEYDPRPDFKAIVNLPEVEVRTGEEEETSLFSSMARLYVFKGTEWKERGSGPIKILHNEESRKTRLLMRRDQIHKICANHLILPGMKLQSMPKVPNSFIWAAADFTDEEVKNEKFCIKFKTLDEAKDFEYAFSRGQELTKETPKATIKTPEPVKATISAPVPIVPAPATTPFSFGIQPPVLAPSGKEPLLKTPTFGSLVTPVLASTGKQPLLKTPVLGSSEKDPLMSDTPVFGTKSSSVDFTSIAKSGGLAEAFKPSPIFTGFAGAGRQLFGTPVTKNGTQVAETPESPGGDDKAEEYEPNQNFTPVVPLPDLVDVKTGEEEEEVLYVQRAKVLRFASDAKEWKEKGVGNFKILKHPETGKIRLLMRREQVHKVCCNHHLDEKMKFERMKSSEKAATWTAQDFSEEEYKPELLAIRFGKSESLEEFLKTIEDLQKQMLDGRVGAVKAPSVTTSKTEQQKPLSAMFKKVEGSWDCDACLVRNKPDNVKCVSCQTQRPGAAKQTEQQKPLSEMFKKAEGSWDCDACLVRNKSDVVKCVSCEALRPGAVDTSPPKPIAKPQQLIDPKLTAGFSFGIPAVTPPIAPSTPATPSAAVNKTPVANSSFTFGAAPVTPASVQSSSAIVFGANKSIASPAFTFGGAAATGGDFAAKFVFGAIKQETVTPVKGVVDSKVAPNEKFSFTFKKPVEESKAAVDSPAQAEEIEDEDDVEREDENLTFKPVVPLPAKVPLLTGEEDEDMLYCQRTKLYRWSGDEWKDRGLGDLKILKHRQTHKVRFLMRREQVHKICLNHYLTKDLEFHAKDQRSWIWTAPDFADGEVDYAQFCIRFRNRDTAQEFWRAMDEARSGVVSSPAAAQRTQSTGSDEDPAVVYQYAGTAEQQKAAKDLQLPPNFYRYLEAEPCPGCPGCETDVSSESGSADRKSPVEAPTDRRSPPKTPVLDKLDDNRPTPSKEPPTIQSADSTDVATEKAPQKPVVRPGLLQKPEGSEDATPKLVIQFGLLPKPSETLFGAKGIEKPKPVETEKPPQQDTPKSSVFANFSFKNAELTKTETAPTIFGSSAGNIFGGVMKSTGTNLFGSAPAATSAFGGNSSIFGGNTIQSSGGSIFGVGDRLDGSQPVFTASPDLTFSQIASKEQGGFSAGAPGWSTEVKPIFGGAKVAKKKVDSEGEEEEGDDGEHDPHFQPVVDLPPLIEVQTGEEGETILFKARAKLYRFDDNTKEWKERGIGEMKVLHDSERNSYRLLLRREQVHKVVLNMRINSNMDLTPKPNNLKSLFWVGMNYAESNGGQEKLAVRFKTDSEAEEFKAAVDSCIVNIKDTSQEVSRFDDSSNTTAIAVDLTNTSSLGGAQDSTVEAEGDESEEEDSEDEYVGEEEDEEDYYEGGESIILMKDSVALYVLDEEAEKYLSVGGGMSMQVMETSRGLRVLVEDDDGELYSDSVVNPATDSVFKLPPRGAMWVALDRALQEPVYRNVLVDLRTPDDAEDLYVTVDAKDLPQDMADTVRKQREL